MLISIGLLDGFNLYQYASNGLTLVDPWRLHASSTFPSTIIVKDSDIIIEYYYHGRGHPLAHAHVKGEGGMIRVRANQKPVKS
ncbi:MULTISPECIES: hypothetical protein [unclassified Gilliamella]|uniref:hypothetical protein n=1 Tax=unclassified Gilliamella TaxID=2685620 RepID=UPI001146220D|nr:hypothetical protein [Gilliamella apicola]